MSGPYSPAFWSRPARIFHWVGAVLVLIQIGMGLAMSHLGLVLDQRFILFQWHKSVGMLILLVMVLRCGWRMFDTAPAHAHSLAGHASRVVHALLYMLVFGAILAGWLAVSASPLRLPTVLFGIWNLPHLTGPDMVLYERATLAHRLMSWGLSLLILLHMLAAFFHHLVLRDQILHRMWR